MVATANDEYLLRGGFCPQGLAPLLLVMVSLRTVLAATTIEVYPPSPDDRSDGKVTGAANGRMLKFSYFRNYPTYYYDTNYCRFAADGPVQVALTIHADFKQAFLRGLLRDISYVRDGRVLRFTLPGPGHYWLQLPDLLRPIQGNPDSGTYTVAFWIDDLLDLRSRAMDPNGDGVAVVTMAGIVSDDQKDQTGVIQALLDKRGRLYFPAGIYRAGTLNLSSNTTVYLAPGAMLKAAVRREGIASRFIYINQAENVKIYGPGTIDANYDGYPRDTANIHIVDVDRSRNITLEDVCFRKCNSWALHLSRCEHVTCRNIRILSGKDGIDPDSSRDVLIENVFIQAKDDAVAVKTRQPPLTTERVAVRNCIVASDASALKIGTETNAAIRNVTFENCDVFDSDRGIVMYARDGGPIENVTWRNIRMFMTDWPHETRGSPFQFVITKRGGLTPVRNCLVENIETDCLTSCSLAGLAEAPLDGLTMKNITIHVGPPARDNRPPLFQVGEHVSVTIDGLTLDWQDNRDKWGQVVSASGLKISTAKQANPAYKW